MKRIAYIVFFALLIVPCTSDAETIDVQIKGVDDGARTTMQRDYKEAVLFAKREAIERAGVKIKSMTTVKDLIVNSDYIESEAEAVLLPGYNILDMGYSADGTYQIVLIGKVKTVSEGIDSKELRYAKSLMDRGEKAKAKKIITDIIENSEDNNAVAEAMYYQVKWNFSSNERDTIEKLKAYYPNSKYVSRIENFFAKMDAEIVSAGGVYDKTSGIEWLAGPTLKWKDMMDWASNHTFAGGGWRVPTIRQLRRFVQKTSVSRSFIRRHQLTFTIYSSEEVPWRDWNANQRSGGRGKSVIINAVLTRTGGQRQVWVHGTQRENTVVVCRQRRYNRSAIVH